MEIIQHTIYEYKLCPDCGVVKLLVDFHKNPHGWMGVQSKCKPCMLAYRKQYYHTNREVILKKQRSRYHDDPQWRERNRQFRKNNPERIRKYKRTDAQRNKESVRRRRAAIVHRYHARKCANGGTFTPQQWKRLCDYFGNLCLCCKTTVALTVDHVVPVSQGGSNDISNIQPLCFTCNRRKCNTAIDYRDPVLLDSFLQSF